jgi:hypothetical protein
MNHVIVHGSPEAQTSVFPRRRIIEPHGTVSLRSCHETPDICVVPDVMIHSLDNFDREGIHHLGTDDGGFL